MTGLFTALGAVSVLALVTGLVLLIINAIRRKPVRFWAFLMLGSFVLAIVSASVGAASRTKIPKEETPLRSEITPTPSVVRSPLPTMPKISSTRNVARTPTPASPTPPSTKEKYRSLTKEETAWALSVQPKTGPSWLRRAVRAYNSWYEEELYSRPPLKPPVEQQGIRRYTLIGIRQNSLEGRQVVSEGGRLETSIDLSGHQKIERIEYIAKTIEVLLKVEALGELPARANFDDFSLRLAKPERWPTKGYNWNNTISDIADRREPGYIPVRGVMPASVSWWPKGGLEVELFYDDRLGGDPFQGTAFEKAKEGIASLYFTVHMDTDITQTGAHLELGGLKIELQGLSEYLLKRD